MASDSDSQRPIFWERLRNLLRRASGDDAGDSDGDASPRSSRRGVALTVCFLISCTVWLSFTLQEVRTFTLELPTEVVGLPADSALARPPPASVRVQMQGESVELLRVYLQAPTVTLRASEAASVRMEEALAFTERSGVRVEGVTPARVELALEPRVTRRLPVAPRLRLDLPPSYERLGPPRLTPDSVAVTGAPSVLDGLTAWPTDSLVVEALRDTVQRAVALRDTLARLVTHTPARVQVTVAAGRFVEAARTVEVRITDLPPSQGVVTLDPSAVEVRYRVLFDHLFASKTAPDFFATVSYDQIRSDTTGRVRPRLQLPADLVIRDPDPEPSRLRYYTFVSNE